ncbi:MAG: biotin carboxylase [Planctomycetota bacterium]|nr:biotin carboxylase [Planctomycetota bacterium]
MTVNTTPARTLQGIPDIRLFFHRNETPIYFISATNFNLLGLDEWVRNFHYISYIDCFDGQHPNVISPSEMPHRPFTSIEDINNYLLEHKEVVDEVRKRTKDGAAGKAVFLFFDEQTEALCEQLGLEVCFPKASLRQEIDNKIMTTRIGDRAGISSVPNVLANLTSYQQMRELTGKLGEDVVIQTAFGDSGHTTFFISSEDDWNKHADEIVADPEVKIMKRIRCRGAAQEACVTRHGTIVGPLMTELVGFKELTPYRGGWCGNEVLAEAFSQDVRNKACDMTFRFGEELRKLGYRGYFELDFLRDLDTDELYLGEVNPRVTGASAMTNLAAFAHADAPLFLFHLLEWADVDFELDVEDLNRRWSDPHNIDSWGQLVIKHTADSVELITSAPRTGIWRLHDDGSVEYVRMQTHRRTVESENQAFFLRILKPGDYKYEGADLGILITPGRLMTEDFELNDRARAWSNGILSQFVSRPIEPAEVEVSAEIAEVGNFKMM